MARLEALTGMTVAPRAEQITLGSSPSPPLSEKDFYSLVESHNGTHTEAVRLTHGTLAGNIVEIAAPKVQFTSIQHTDSDGELAFQLAMSFLPVLGNDELVLMVK